MEQVDTDINVPNKDEPTWEQVKEYCNKRCLDIVDSALRKKWYKDEPQTYVINPQEPTNDDKCFECDDFFTCGGQCNKIEDESQTERSE